MFNGIITPFLYCNVDTSQVSQAMFLQGSFLPGPCDGWPGTLQNIQSAMQANYLCIVYMIGHAEFDIHRLFNIDENSQKNN